MRKTKTAIKKARNVMVYWMLDVAVRMDNVKRFVSKTLSVTNMGIYFLILASCGIFGAFFFTACSQCGEDGCEDVGACKWINGKCVDV